jgi:hypothetical protein
MAWFLTTNAINVTTGEKYMKFEKFQGLTSNQYVDTVSQINVCAPTTVPNKFLEYSGTLVHEFNSFLEAIRHPKCS